MKRFSQDHFTIGPPPGAARRAGVFVRATLTAGRVCLLLAVTSILVKWVGEAVSDRYQWSQWPEWTPNVLVVAGALSLITVGWVLRRIAVIAARPAGLERAGGRPGAIAWALLVLHAGYTIVVDAPFYRSRAAAPGSLDDSLRVAFWNVGAAEQPGWEQEVMNSAPDLVVLVGLSTRDSIPPALARMFAEKRLVYERFTVLSSRPLSRFGFTNLNIMPGSGFDPRLPKGVRANHDPGAAMYLEVRVGNDPDELLTVWIVDLPSDISLSRERVAREARAAIDGFDGQRLIRSEQSSWTVETDTGFTGNPGFPTPDLIIGDFNIPRGAASLEHLRNGYPDAFEQAATGYMASWPRRFPMWHLDQAFIGPRWRAWGYDLRSTGSGSHLMQVLDLTAR